MHGAVYDIFSGEVEWLGEHPDLCELVGRKMPMRDWRQAKYSCLVLQ